MTTDNTKLTACPFCGTHPRYVPDRPGFYTERVICKKCGFNLPPEIWNHRVTQTAPEQAAHVCCGKCRVRDTYEGTREDLLEWKKRALKVEGLVRKFTSEVNGPTCMGEPDTPQGVSSSKAIDFLEIPDVEDESGINTHYSRDLVLECIEAALAQAGQAAPADEVVSEPSALQSTAPKRIYLDVGDQFALERVREGGISWRSLEDVTWSKDNATGHGVEYVRADLATPATEPAAPSYVSVMRQALAALESCGAGAVEDGGTQWFDEKLVESAHEAISQALAAAPAAQPTPQSVAAPVAGEGAKAARGLLDLGAVVDLVRRVANVGYGYGPKGSREEFDRAYAISPLQLLAVIRHVATPVTLQSLEGHEFGLPGQKMLSETHPKEGV